jgi:hypothetical protein
MRLIPRGTEKYAPAMRALLVSLLVPLLALAMMACATYRDDLDRALVHYHANEYDKSLALLEVLEPDIDSLSPSERARYSYYRGMSHYRLDQRLVARHWLGLSSARNKANPGSLSGEEKKRVDDTLGELNEARWGGAKTPASSGKSCATPEDCGGGEPCVEGMCKAAEGAEGETTTPAQAPPEPSESTKPAP